MFTVRQIERLWNAGQFDRIISNCMEMRNECSSRLLSRLAGSAESAAAAAVIRMDELSISHMPICGELIRFILSAQQADGGWGTPLVTALCVRALACNAGEGLAIERGIAHLAELQKSEGIWPGIAFRRLPADAFVSAFILHQLGGDARLRRAVRFDDAMRWFELNQRSLDVESKRLWRGVASRSVGRLHEPVWS